MAGSLDSLVGQRVVLDTGQTTFYMGKLASVADDGFWLEDADVHHQDEGHASREQYVAEAARDGIHTNRQRVFVFRETVISVSALSDVIRD